MFLSREGAAQRFPHRAAGATFRARPVNVKNVASFLHKTPPKYVIAGNLLQTPRPAVTATPFEPTDIAQDSEHMAWLMVMNLEQQGYKSEMQGESNLRRSPTVREQFRGLRAALRRWGGLGWYVLLAYLAYRWWAGGQPYHVFFAVGVLFIAVSRLQPLFSERRWWIVPGGLVCREFHFWRRGLRLGVFTPEDTPLLVDARSGRGYLLDDGRVRSFPCPQWISWVVVAAWISQARRRTLDELRSFAGMQGAGSGSA